MRAASEGRFAVSPISVTFGVIQTLFYFDFAWVYWTRQRVKLRYGGVVDGEDISRGWLISRIIGRRGNSGQDSDDDDDAGLAGQEEGIIRPGAGRSHNSWGPRGISVSADEGVHEGEAARLADPAAFEDDYEDDAVVVSPAVSEAGHGDGGFKDQVHDDDDVAKKNGISDGAEWRNEEHS